VFRCRWLSNVLKDIIRAFERCSRPVERLLAGFEREVVADEPQEYVPYTVLIVPRQRARPPWVETTDTDAAALDNPMMALPLLTNA
jgi:hypothetical protein